MFDPFNNLNPNQIKAVKHGLGPLLILAGAGSGKTRTITQRIAYLINEQNIMPLNILAVTFTNKAAGEMKSRVEKLIDQNLRGLWIGTFHSICLRILKRDIDFLDGYDRNFVIYDDADQTKLIRDSVKQLGYNDKLYEPRTIRGKIDRFKNSGDNPDIFENEFFDERLKNIYELYQKELRRQNALDFTDLLKIAVDLLDSKKQVRTYYQRLFQHILVDEYQDTNFLQYKFIKLLAGDQRNLFVVGDDNQSIYGWRGADIRNILNFEKDFSDTKVIKLDQNYRSSKLILDAANELIKYNTERKDKTLWTENPQGELIDYFEADNEKLEAKFVINELSDLINSDEFSYNDVAIFYRTNNQSKAIEDELIYSGIPYSIVGGVGFYQRAEIKDLIAYLKILLNPRDDLSLKRIINVPARGIGKATVEAVGQISRENSISLLDGIKKVVEEKLLSKGPLSKLENFLQIIESLNKKLESSGPNEILEELLEITGYMDYIELEEDRIKNVSELVNLASEFENQEDGSTLEEFLDWISLASDIDRFKDDADKVTLMTIHTAKGLEFPIVFMIGMEERLFPHVRSFGDNKQLEEERRLCYVGVTRAKKKVFLTSACSRRYFGVEQGSIPSRFLDEIPDSLINNRNDEQLEKLNGDEIRERLSKNYRKKYTASSKNKKKSGKFSFGKAVNHPKFGKGVIKKVEGEGDDAKVTVVFQGVGSKTVLASFLK
ncbi:MAG: UvrD-helicase domain-containing protein [Candidatus Dadabacteria bacterium]|nr:UvrD-helicase domain-containing protein [Candidatus Dadabacteria bacterium]NIQ14391.1 UvrD-helicase domain-containing protein [Candidatus Dadabacteria bacterium]